MKTVNPNILNALNSENHRCTFIARLTRKDGKRFGFIEADQDITIDGVVYRAMGGMQSSTTKQSSNGTPNHQTFVGWLESPDINEQELAAGFFDDAKVDIAMIDLDNPPATFTPGDVLWIGSFFMGEVKIVDGVFQAEIISLADKLKTIPIEVTSPTCRAKFGDARCKFNLSTVTIDTTVAEVISNTQIRAAVDLSALSLKFGTLHFTSGVLSGQSYDISSGNVDLIDLFIPLDILPAVGDSIRVIGGCDKTIDQCRAYNNAINFQGEPNIPGSDKWKAGFKEVL